MWVVGFELCISPPLLARLCHTELPGESWSLTNSGPNFLLLFLSLGPKPSHPGKTMRDDNT